MLFFRDSLTRMAIPSALSPLASGQLRAWLTLPMRGSSYREGKPVGTEHFPPSVGIQLCETLEPRPVLLGQPPSHWFNYFFQPHQIEQHNQALASVTKGHLRVEHVTQNLIFPVDGD